ncbi:MAG: peptidoglycan-associated lipoprotein Pal, partial [Gammaproteobacteria bacterium]
MLKYKLAVLTLMTALVAGCASNTVPDPDPTDTTYGESGSGADTDVYGDDPMGRGEEIGDDYLAGELTNVIYFDFDSAEVRADFTDIVARHALVLANDSSIRVRLEGHADERGSREYNIGLGERRSQSVRRMLMIQGASAAQISTVSFGEERPVALGSDEDSWAQNRRVEIKY